MVGKVYTPFDTTRLSGPNSDGNVCQRQSCPAFTKRENSFVEECWYCVYADFHLYKEKTLDIGICNYPNKIIL